MANSISSNSTNLINRASEANSFPNRSLQLIPPEIVSNIPSLPIGIGTLSSSLLASSSSSTSSLSTSSLSTSSQWSTVDKVRVRVLPQNKIVEIEIQGKSPHEFIKELEKQFPDYMWESRTPQIDSHGNIFVSEQGFLFFNRSYRPFQCTKVELEWNQNVCITQESSIFLLPDFVNNEIHKMDISEEDLPNTMRMQMELLNPKYIAKHYNTPDPEDHLYWVSPSPHAYRMLPKIIRIKNMIASANHIQRFKLTQKLCNPTMSLEEIAASLEKITQNIVKQIATNAALVASVMSERNHRQNPLIKVDALSRGKIATFLGRQNLFVMMGVCKELSSTPFMDPHAVYGDPWEQISSCLSFRAKHILWKERTINYGLCPVQNTPQDISGKKLIFEQLGNEIVRSKNAEDWRTVYDCIVKLLGSVKPLNDQPALLSSTSVNYKKLCENLCPGIETKTWEALYTMIENHAGDIFTFTVKMHPTTHKLLNPTNEICQPFELRISNNEKAEMLQTKVAAHLNVNEEDIRIYYYTRFSIGSRLSLSPFHRNYSLKAQGLKDKTLLIYDIQKGSKAFEIFRKKNSNV